MAPAAGDADDSDDDSLESERWRVSPLDRSLWHRPGASFQVQRQQRSMYLENLKAPFIDSQDEQMFGTGRYRRTRLNVP